MAEFRGSLVGGSSNLGLAARFSFYFRQQCLGKLRLVRLLFVLVALAGAAWGGDAERLFNKGRKAARAGRDVEAYVFFQRARASNPAERRYSRAAAAIQPRAAQTLAAFGRLDAALALEPHNSYLLAEAHAESGTPSAELAEATKPPLRQLRPPIEIEHQAKRTSFKLKGSLRTLYETVLREFGIDVLFDQDFDGDSEVRFTLDDCDFQQAILALNHIANAIVVPVHSKLLLVADDTKAKRSELEPMAVVTIPIPDVLGREEATQLAQGVQQVLDIKRLQLDAVRQQVVLRDTVFRTRMAQALYQHLAKPRAEVVVDLELITVSESRQVDFGVSLPTAFPVTNFSTIFRNMPPTLGSVPLLGLGGGGTVFGIGIATANLVARLTAGKGRVLSRFQLRSTDGLPATLNIGERFPIINASFSPILSTTEIDNSTADRAFRQPIPSFTFEDLGLIFNVTPHVHSAREISLEIEVEVKALAGSSVNDVPIISNSQFKSYIRLREAEVAVVTGMAMFQQSRTRSGLAWLSEIPLIGRLFGDETRRYDRTDLILTVKPRIVRLPPAEHSPSLTLRYGPEQRPLPAL